MENEGLSEKEQEQAKIFRSRVVKSPEDLKRHDRMKPDERQWIMRVHRRLGWSDRKIGGVLNRNWRAVKRVIEIYGPRKPHVTPRLIIGSPSNRYLTDGLDFAKFASVNVCANGSEAKGCWGWARVLPSGPSLQLHWKETSFKEEQTDASRIFIRPDTPAVLEIAFALPYPRVTETPQEADPCQEVPCFLEGLTRRLTRWQGEGCWLARPSAMENPDPQLEAYLAPGQYRIEVTTGCENGKGDSREFTLRSAGSWRDLGVVELERVDG